MKINIPRSAVLTLIEVLEKILFKLAENNGDNKTAPVERSLPFGLKYKLVSNYNSLVTVASDYDTKRKEIIKKYGVENEETHEYSIQDEESKSKALDEITKMLAESVIVEVLKISTKEIEEVNDESIELSTVDIILLQEFLVKKETDINDIREPRKFT